MFYKPAFGGDLFWTLLGTVPIKTAKKRNKCIIHSVLKTTLLFTFKYLNCQCFAVTYLGKPRALILAQLS